MAKVLRKGTFHLHNDKNGGHPALIVEKNDKKNIYKAVKFTHKDGAARTKLKHNIDPEGRGNTYVHNIPVIDSKNKFGSKELDRYRVHKDDKVLISKIKRKK